MLHGELEGKPRLQKFPRAPDPSPFLCLMSPLFYLPSASSRSMCLVPWKMFLRPATFTGCSQEKTGPRSRSEPPLCREPQWTGPGVSHWWSFPN